MKEIKGKILIIPDIHQNLKFANGALERDFDHVVFLGDYFDCFETPDNEEYFSVRYVCDWLNNKRLELGDRATWLLGNHDLAYLATYLPNTYRLHNPNGKFYCCSGWSGNKAKTFNQYIDPEFVKGLELCVKAEDFVCSHAGFHYAQFDYTVSDIENIKILYDEWEKTKHVFRNKPFHWIGRVGACRGGIDEVGSPIWLDWNQEFYPLDNVRQIVGHTNGQSIRAKSLDENTKDYCLDAYRTSIGILEDGKLGFDIV